MTGLSISKKLYGLFLIFILIFFGTVTDLFFRVQDMSEQSDHIVSVNKQVGELSKELRGRLVDMEANARKFTVLKKPVYFEAFETARKAYVRTLDQILMLEQGRGPSFDPWRRMGAEYGHYTTFRDLDAFSTWSEKWGRGEMVGQWIAGVDLARWENEDEMSHTLVEINDQSRRIIRNGIMGFGVSLLAGGLGIWFISRSMLRPLKRLKQGLSRVSTEDYDQKIQVVSRDEFGEVASAFNAMSRQLKADEEIRSDFIATLSHEIRTPLASIRESVNMMAEEVLGPVTAKQKRFLTLADDGIRRISRLLTHLLETSVQESGSVQWEPEVLDLDALARDAVASLEGTARVKSVGLLVLPRENAPGVVGDRRALTRVMVNLVGNAIKFSPKEGVIRIGFQPGETAGFFQVNVMDEGPGIPRDQQSLIFKKYYRCGSVRQHMDGVGLGLSIARRIVRDHGGEITVRNNPDRGATFSFTLPVAENGERGC